MGTDGEAAQRIRKELVNIEFDRCEVELAGFYLRDVEHVINDRHQAGCRRGNDVDVFRLLGCEARFAHDFGHPDDAVHGRSNLVGHVGQEFAFRLIRRLGGPLQLRLLLKLLLDELRLLPNAAPEHRYPAEGEKRQKQDTPQRAR